MQIDWKQIGAGMAVGAAIVGVAWFALGATDAEEKSFSVMFGDASISMNTRGGRIDHGSLLKTIFFEQFSRDGALGWLRDVQNVYSIEDPALAAALNTKLCEEIPDHPIDVHIAKGTACTKISVVDNLRRLVEGHKVPFHYVGREVQVGIQGDPEHAPRASRANACEGSDLSGKRVELTNLLNENQITVLATGIYPCSGVSVKPDLQLNPEDARKLFDGPLRKYQPAIAVPLN